MTTYYRGRSVLITGHTGFKGGWLAMYLSTLGARVHGFGRSRTTGPSFYDATNVRRRLAGETVGDLRDALAVKRAMREARPDIVFHLAARTIVTESLDDPTGTFDANIMGSVNLLEAVRQMDPMPVVVMVTSDKVYRNTGERVAFSEDARLGGLDPYGASKACVELIADSYRATYGVPVATARCANVIGGGDWGAQRLVPTCLRAFSRGEPVTIHDASRVWLHVLDAVRGYAMLGASMPSMHPLRGPAAFNFGPRAAWDVSVVAVNVAAAMGADISLIQHSDRKPEREAAHLNIDSTRARDVLRWTPRWSLAEAIDRTVAWHRAHVGGADMELVTMEQIAEHVDEGQRRAA